MGHGKLVAINRE